MQTEAETGGEAATSPGTDAWSPQKPGKAGRTLPWRLWTELSPGTPGPQTSGLQGRGRVDFLFVLMPWFVVSGHRHPGKRPTELLKTLHQQGKPRHQQQYYSFFRRTHFALLFLTHAVEVAMKTGLGFMSTATALACSRLRGRLSSVTYWARS